jgi:tetratricopeptide (TPR) repeat protein
MDSFPSSKAHELETEFDGLVPMMSCNDVDDETSYRKKNRHDGTNSSDEESNYSGSEGEEEQISQQPTLSAMKDVSEVFGPNVDLLWSRKRAKGKNVKLGKTAGCVLPQEISDSLSQAQFHYANGDYPQAIELLSTVTRLAPHLPDPFHIMALIYEESGDKLRSLQFFVLAAVHTPKSADVWIKVCDLATDLKEYDQAMSALNHAMKREQSVNFYVKKILLLIQMDQLYSARQLLKSFLTKYPNEIPVLADFGHACQIAGYTEVAVHSYLRLAYHIMGSIDVSKVEDDIVTNALSVILMRFLIERSHLIISSQNFR